MANTTDELSTVSIIKPHQKLLQSDRSFTHQHFKCLVLSAFESCHLINIMLPRKTYICHVRDINASLQTQYLSCVVQESNSDKSSVLTLKQNERDNKLGYKVT